MNSDNNNATGSQIVDSIRDQVSEAGRQIVAKLDKDRKKVMWTGIALIILGVLALVFPNFTTLTVDIMIGWLLLIFGIIGFFNAFSYDGTGPFFGALLTSILAIAAGVYLLVHPDVGTFALTIIVSVLFLVDGTFKMVLAFDIKPIRGWGWVVVSSIASIVLGIMIAAGLPDTSMYTIGLLVGINFLIAGVSIFMLSRQIQKIVPSPAN